MNIALLLVAASIAAVPVPATALQEGLRSKDALERLAAVDQVEAGARGEGAKALIKLFGDSDWEVVERAAARLAELGTPGDLGAAVELALDGPVRRVRRQAALTAARLDADGATQAFQAKAKGKNTLHALEAIALAAPHGKVALPARPLERLTEDKEPRTRAAAAAAWVAGPGDGRAAVLKRLLVAEHVMVQAAAAEQAAELADVALAETLGERLAGEAALAPVVERRVARALVASFGAMEADEAAKASTALVERVISKGGAAIAARGVRLARRLAGASWADKTGLFAALAPAFVHSDVGVRAQAVASLPALAADGALAKAREIADDDTEPRVRRAAVRAAFALESIETDAGLAFAKSRLATEKDVLARQDVLVELGRRGFEAALPVLIEALDTDDWRLVVAAAVSLGKTRLEGALGPLEALRGRSGGDWRGRASAVAGLVNLYRTDAVPTVIDALADAEPMVRRMAHGWLLAATGETFGPELEPWRAWWSERGERVVLVDLAELDERERRYGYAGASPQEVYRGLDVLVLQSRGDTVQQLLEHTGVPHRLSTSGQVRQHGPDPRGLFVANCTGEITAADVEALEFFLHSGGYVFGSCWALEETIARIAPGNARRLQTKGEVLDNVRAYAAAPGSPYLEGVFTEGSVPVYALEGAYLIDVVAPERVEVLVDSPEAAERWGGGDLAAWFRVGHGLALDSVNHFDVQGLERAQGLRKPEERQAYAADHMAYDYAFLRQTRDEDYWSSTSKASRAVPDLSVFRLVTNFVRLRRLAGD